MTDVRSWDEAYSREIKNNTANADDQGTVWFSDTGAEEKTLQLLEDLSDDGVITAKDSARCLDLGTGNGHMLFALADDGWEGPLIGVDYSPASVELARQISASRGSDGPDFQVWDLLAEQPGSWIGQGFDLVLDKGTFDAIALSGDTDADGNRICESYRKRVLPLLRTGGHMVITSCNWTREELIKWFVTNDGALTFDGHEVKYPSFTFGGQKGQSVCTLLFRRTNA